MWTEQRVGQTHSHQYSLMTTATQATVVASRFEESAAPGALLVGQGCREQVPQPQALEITEMCPAAPELDVGGQGASQEPAVRGPREKAPGPSQALAGLLASRERFASDRRRSKPLPSQAVRPVSVLLYPNSPFLEGFVVLH